MRLLLSRTLPLGVSLWLVSFALSGSEIAWNQFRGPDGDGHVPGNPTLPTHWSEDHNVAWKVPIHGRAWSSPVVADGRIWLTTASEDGHDLSFLCLDANTGKLIHDRQLFRVAEPQFAHKFNSYASPTPIIDGDRVYVTWGSPGTACLDAKTGGVLWERTDIECNHFRGAGSSPIIHQDLLILNFDGSDHQFITAWDKHTGRTVWRTERSVDFRDLDEHGKPKMDGDLRKAFATPHIARLAGKDVLISVGAKACYGYDPQTGQELWMLEEPTSHSASSRPIALGDRFYWASGWPRGEVHAYHVTSASPVSESDRLWMTKRGVPKKPSLLYHNGHLFLLNDGGILSCLDATTGDEVWSERVGGNYSASPILSDGLIYCLNEEGICVVVKAAPTFEIVAENKLDDGFMASPAVHGDALILRTKSHLYRIQGS